MNIDSKIEEILVSYGLQEIDIAEAIDLFESLLLDSIRKVVGEDDKDIDLGYGIGSNGLVYTKEKKEARNQLRKQILEKAKEL